MNDLDKIRQRANKATPGPWDLYDHAHLEPGCRCLGHYEDATVWQTTNSLDCDDIPTKTINGKPSQRCHESGYTYEDADFIAHARTDITDLCDEVEQLRAALGQSKPEDS